MLDLQFYLFYGLFFYEIYSLSPCHCIIVCRTYKTVKIEFSRNLTPPPSLPIYEWKHMVEVARGP